MIELSDNINFINYVDRSINYKKETSLPLEDTAILVHDLQLL